MNAIKEKIKNASSLEGIASILGEPDFRDGPTVHTAEMKETYHTHDVRQTVRYIALSVTFDLVIQEYEEGVLGIFYMGKLKGLE